MSYLRKILTSPYTYIFFLSYYGIWLIWNYIKIPSHVPAGIISAVGIQHYNPTDNILRFLAAVLVPPVACLLCWLIEKYWPKFKWVRGKIPRVAMATIVIILGVCLASAVAIVQDSTNPANNPQQYGGPYSNYLVDTFHEGETLGPAESYESSSLKPYTNFVIIHGVFQDPLRSVIAFKLFGRSIGAERTFTMILYIITGVLFWLLLLILFRGDYIKAVLGFSILAILGIPALTLSFIPSLQGIQLPFRDIATAIFLGAAILGLRYALAKRMFALSICSGVVGFIVTAGYANSLDRALYITVLAVFWAAMVLLLFNNFRSWTKYLVLSGGIGLLLGIIVLGLALKWDFTGLIQYLLRITNYETYLDTITLTRPTLGLDIVYLSLAGMIGLVCIWITGSWKVSKKQRKGIKGALVAIKDYLRQAVAHYPVEILLGITALLFMRSAIERADNGHFAYSVQYLYIFILYLGINYIFKRKALRIALSYLTLMLFVFVLLFFGAQVKHIDIARDTFPVNIPDSQLVRPDYLQTADYIKDNLHGKQSFITLTSEGVWYYLVNKPCPIQYPIIYYAFTQSQRESLAKSIADNPNIKYIITNDNWTTDFDYVPNPVRFPEVYRVFYKDYHPQIGFGQQTVWERNNYQ
jgi:hypothetical protein